MVIVEVECELSWTLTYIYISSHKVSEMTEITSNPNYNDLFHPLSALATMLQGVSLKHTVLWGAGAKWQTHPSPNNSFILIT